ncbi:MAG TPA: Plug domain-containing protein, partial [Gemmatimonadaceae bacterium]
GTGYHSRGSLGNSLQYGRLALDHSGVSTLGEFLQNVPGLHVLDPKSTNSMTMSRSLSMPNLSNTSLGNCHVGWFIDGHRMDMPGRLDPVTDGLGSMQLETIEAVEVFRGLAEMPPEFAEPDLRCGAIAVWTRHGD